jgi:hypothetical protein
VHEVQSTSIAVALRSQLARRLVIGISVGMAAFLLFQVIRLIAVASGLCTWCAAADEPDVLGAVALGGGGAVLGGGGGDDEEDPGRSRFDRWLDDVLGGGRPPRSVEGVEPPSAPSPPPDPEAQRRAEEEARQLFDLYKRLIGTKGPVDMPEGSVGGELNNAMDRVLDFSSGSTDVGPSGDGDTP